MDDLVKRATRKYCRESKRSNFVLPSDKSYSDKFGPETYVMLVDAQMRPFAVYFYNVKGNKLIEVQKERWPKEVWRGFLSHQAKL